MRITVGVRRDAELGGLMQLRKMFTAFVLVLGVSLLLFGRGSGADDRRAYDGDMRIITRPEQADLPPAATVSTPKGDRTVKPAEIGHYDIPLTALLAYQRAADILAAVKPGCDLSWTLLAAIGRVESDHGRYADSTLGTDGVASPQVIGVALDGAGPVAKIRDTDHGRWDQDPRWDRAVGPMQFLPATWQMVAVDGDGDGTRSIDDVDDAALAAGVYLCAGPEGDLGSAAAMESALHRYNDSDAYVALVMAYEKKYRGGDFEVVTRGGEVAEASAVLSGHPLTGSPTAGRGVAAEIRAGARKAAAEAEKTGGTTPGISAKPSVATRTSGSEAGGGTVLAGADDGRSPAEADSGATSPSAAGSGSGSPAGGSGTPSPPPPGPTGSDTATPGTGDPTPSAPGSTGSTDPGSTGSGSTGSGSTDSGSPSGPTADASCTATPETATPSPSPDETTPDPEICKLEATEPSADATTCEPTCAPTPTPTP